MARYLAQGLGTYPPEIAYRARRRNFITHWILQNHAEIYWLRLASLSASEKLATVNKVLSDFWFVGDYTRCDELIAALAPDLRVPAKAVRRNTLAEWQDRVGWKPLKIEDLGCGAIEQIRRENMLDQLLWEAWCDTDQAQLEHVRCEARLLNSVVRDSLRVVYQIERRFIEAGILPVERGNCQLRALWQHKLSIRRFGSPDCRNQ